MTRRPDDSEHRGDPGPLFRAPPHNGTPTSVAAAMSVADKSATQRAAVYACIAAHPNGLTREEIEERMSLPGNAVRPRVWELLGNNGHPQRVRESGTTRKTKAGRAAEVVVAV